MYMRREYLQWSFFALIVYLFIAKKLLTTTYSTQEFDHDNLKSWYEYGFKKINSVASK